MNNLIRKYNVAGPRYTSYPTVPYWESEKFSNDLWQQSFIRSFEESNDKSGVSLYIHLPFCESLCTFCACHKRITKQHSVERPYIEAVLKEWQMYLDVLGKKQIISFASGGTTAAIDSCYEWKKVMRKANFVNLMSYDLTSGFSTTSGHHTPLYSNDKQAQSTDNGVQRLLAAGVPANQIVIGAAFYARLFAVEDTLNNGLYRPAKFYHGLPYNRFTDSLTIANGYTDYWDSVSNAPYSFNPERKLFATYDNPKSLQIKTNYVIKNKLLGIMFWQLTEDVYSNGLLHTIDETKKAGMQ